MTAVTVHNVTAAGGEDVDAVVNVPNRIASNGQRVTAGIVRNGTVAGAAEIVAQWSRTSGRRMVPRRIAARVKPQSVTIETGDATAMRANPAMRGRLSAEAEGFAGAVIRALAAGLEAATAEDFGAERIAPYVSRKNLQRSWTIQSCRTSWKR
jgi:hypothetical protein